LLSRKMGLWPEKIVEKNYEVDIALTDFQKLVAVVEVKWKENIPRSELRNIEEKLSRFPCKSILYYYLDFCFRLAAMLWVTFITTGGVSY